MADLVKMWRNSASYEELHKASAPHKGCECDDCEAARCDDCGCGLDDWHHEEELSTHVQLICDSCDRDCNPIRALAHLKP